MSAYAKKVTCSNSSIEISSTNTYSIPRRDKVLSMCKFVPYISCISTSYNAVARVSTTPVTYTKTYSNLFAFHVTILMYAN